MNETIIFKIIKITKMDNNSVGIRFVTNSYYYNDPNIDILKYSNNKPPVLISYSTQDSNLITNEPKLSTAIFIKNNTLCSIISTETINV